MPTRHLYLARHGAADPFGTLTADGRRQANLLGARLRARPCARLGDRAPVDAVWHSPLPRAADTARELARHLPGVPVAPAGELVDHVPYVPATAETPPSWAGFFDGYDTAEAAAGHRTAQTLVTRFTAATDRDTHEVLITHAYPIAWLVRHALDAPPARWLGLESANTGLTLIEYRTGLPPALVFFNDLGHLPAELRWTGFRGATRA